MPVIHNLIQQRTMETSMLRTHLRTLFQFDQWANETIADALRTAPPGPARDEAARLFAHVERASTIWLGRVRGTSDADLPVWPTAAESSDVSATAARSRERAAAWRAHLHRATDADLQRPTRYRNSSGRAFATPLSEIATHVVLHGGHHRAQITRLLREAGATPPGIDFIVFARSGERRLRDAGLMASLGQ